MQIINLFLFDNVNNSFWASDRGTLVGLKFAGTSSELGETTILSGLETFCSPIPGLRN